MTFCAGAIFVRPPTSIRTIGTRAALHRMTPQPCDWSKALPADGDALGNDERSWCWEVAQQWVIALRRANTAGDMTRPAIPNISAAYTKLEGFDPTTNTPDDGTDTAKGMTDWCVNGIRVGGWFDIPHWLTVDPTNTLHLAIALWCAGPLMATWKLMMAHQDPANWSQAPGNSVDWTTPWAEHETVLVACDGGEQFVTRTWGLDLPPHPDQVRQYCVHVDVPLDLATGGWLATTGRTPMGLDRDALAGDLVGVAA